MRRANEPLRPKPMHLLVRSAEQYTDTLKGLMVLIQIFTGIRANTLCHLHYEWFQHDEGALYLKVPRKFPCMKYGSAEPCGDCNGRDTDGYSPKTYVGEGRRLKIPEKWHDTYTDSVEQSPLKLRKMIEHYFKREAGDYGNEMLDGDGVSVSTANRYVKEVAEEAQIGPYLKPGYIDHSKLGLVPDIMTHDLRATYCVQLMRNDANPFKAITRTGHEDVESLKPYIKFAKGEFDGDFEGGFI